MKRAVATFALIITANTVVGPRLCAQPPSGGLSVEAAKGEFDRQQQRVSDALIEALKAAENATDRDNLRQRIRPLVEETFDARQRLQSAELDELRHRLNGIEQAIHAREKNREVIINSRLDELLSGQTADRQTHAPLAGLSDSIIHRPAVVQKGQGTQSAPVPMGPGQPAPRGSKSAAGEGHQPPLADFDIETRERLAELDVQAAEEDYVAAQKELSAAQGLYELGTLSSEALRARVKDHRHAATELKRAETKLAGLARQRAELEAAADAAANEADAELKQAVAKARACKASYQSASAAVGKSQADLDAAESALSYRSKAFERVKNLVEEKAVDVRARDEAEERYDQARAALAGAKAAVEAAHASANERQAAWDEASAAVNLATLRADAAKAQRDRLKRPSGTAGNAPTLDPIKDDKPAEQAQ